MILRILHTLLLLLLFSGWSSGQPEPGKKIENYFGTELVISDFNTFLELKMDSLNIPGLSFALINDGEVVHHKALGYADVEQKKPVTDQTIFEGASLSKSVFAFFVMTFVEEDKLDLDKSLWEYLPYPDIAGDERYKKITARMVLSHRSGLPNWRSDEMDGRLKIYFEPGTDYKYSGEGYQYLAKVLMEIENTDPSGLEDIFQQRIAKPLGLEHTVFLQTSSTKEHKAVPYDENGRRMMPPMDDGEFGAAYSIHSQSIDFARWMIALMNRELLTEESYNELFKRHSSVPNEEPDLYYTLGFMTPDFPDLGPNIYMHYGNNEGFTSMYILDTEKKWGIVVFTNSEYGQDLGNELAEYLVPEPESNAISSSESKVLKIMEGHKESVRSVEFTPDGEKIVSGSMDKTVKIWDVATDNLIHELRHNDYVFNVSVSPKGKVIATAVGDGSIKLWDIESGNLIATMQSEKEQAYHVSFSQDGSRLVSGGSDNIVRVWDVKSRRKIIEFKGHKDFIWVVAFSSNGKEVASASWDGTVKIWDVEKKELRLDISAHSERIEAMAYSSNGERLVTGSFDNSLTVWNSTTGAKVATIKKHSGEPWCLIFSPDGEQFASAAQDKTIRIWNTQSATEIMTLVGHTAGVQSVHFSYDGGKLVSSSNDKTVRLWDIN